MKLTESKLRHLISKELDHRTITISEGTGNFSILFNKWEKAGEKKLAKNQALSAEWDQIGDASQKFIKNLDGLLQSKVKNFTWNDVVFRAFIMDAKTMQVLLSCQFTIDIKLNKKYLQSFFFGAVKKLLRGDNLPNSADRVGISNTDSGKKVEIELKWFISLK